MTTIQHPDTAHDEPPAPATDERTPPSPDERMLERAQVAHDLILAGFDGPLFLSYVVWPAPLPARAA
jgi:hypothetical protein